MHIFQVTTQQEIAEAARMAREIWTAHYVPIVGLQQVDYMLERFQSESAIAAQISEGFEYFSVMRDGGLLGYAAVVPEDGETLFLSKIYVRESARGCGAGNALLSHGSRIAEDRGFSQIRLTVNRHNRETIAWYQRRGFVQTGLQCQDIGGGFVMDDFVMSLSLHS
jgi:ribosomal protein S18 acetylase RimI-like enzyme